MSDVGADRVVHIVPMLQLPAFTRWNRDLQEATQFQGSVADVLHVNLYLVQDSEAWAVKVESIVEPPLGKKDAQFSQGNS
ncbi:MAG: hypothetical protein JSS65_06425 [Armatimonadetes bacterium]|nr:hypothetical protein [Armatimonadota bacterium]